MVLAGACLPDVPRFVAEYPLGIESILVRVHNYGIKDHRMIGVNSSLSKDESPESKRITRSIKCTRR